ncbi:MAG: hypothetical protein AAF613_09425 [Pseudomonadota bacterium]
MRFHLATLLLAGGLTACGEQVTEQTGGVHRLAEGASKVFIIPSAEPRMVSFRVVFDSPSWAASETCPEQDVGTPDHPFMLQICGGIYDTNEDNKTSASGQHGAGVTFQPTDGEIRVRLVNYAPQAMDFEVDVEDLD